MARTVELGAQRRRAAARVNHRYDRVFEKVLHAAAVVFADKGYGAASIRDIARKTGMSLAGLYYYFSSKDELLYFIQKHCFETLLERLEQRLQSAADPEEKLRALIESHLEHFTQNVPEMKVLSHESNSLSGSYLAEINQIKRHYYKICLGVIQQLEQSGRIKPMNPRVAVMSLFGMMNWIYNWYSEKRDGPAAELARQMSEIYLRGILR